MPVRKFHSVAEMPEALIREPLDPDNLRIACELSVFAMAMHPRRREPGVRRYRSAEEAVEARDAWEQSR